MIRSYYQDEWVTQYCADALKVLPELPSDSIDLLCTDPPYGIGFMGKDWDKALADRGIWDECFRVLKDGSFAFVMSIPRSDCLSRMIISLEDAGFLVNFTPIFWAYASGFPKAQNIGKAVDKRLGVERAVVGRREDRRYKYGFSEEAKKALGTKVSDEVGGFVTDMADITAPATPQAKALDGSYGGFQPKPAVEVIIVAMKPLSEKTFVDQALKNKKGITWLDNGRIPYDPDDKPEGGYGGMELGIGKPAEHQEYRGAGVVDDWGRFPANLLVSDDALNDGQEHNQGGSVFCGGQRQNRVFGVDDSEREDFGAYGDSGSFSRYFDLDKWAQKTFPFLIVPKASKSEKNQGLGIAVVRTEHGSTPRKSAVKNMSPNDHPTVKPLKLMTYLVTLGSRAGDTVLDPFSGSGTTPLASKLLNRKCIGMEVEERYCVMVADRCRRQMVMDLSHIGGEPTEREVEMPQLL